MAYTLNTLSTISPILLREGLMALRENSIMAALCQFDVSNEAAQKGATINVVIPPVIPAQEISIGTPNTPTPLVPSIVPVVLDQWWESTFAMSDRDIGDVKAGLLPATASEAIKSLANKIDISALGLYKDLNGYAGAAASTPDAIADITAARKILNRQLAPLGNRAMLIDVEAEAAFLGLQAFTAVNESGDTAALREGSLGRKFGFDIHMDQNMPYHTKGTLAAGTSIGVSANAAAGATSVALEDTGAASLVGTLVKGDIITFSTITNQSFVITELVTAAANAIASAKFYPPLPDASVVDGTVVTVIGSHRVNLAFNKQAFCFVSRPLEVVSGLGSIVESIADPISGVTLRLEITRSNKQMIWSYDVLWGVKTIRPQLGCRLLG